MHTLNSLGLPKPPEQTRVVVAMSGGVDSSVVAAMLKEQGYEVIGITLQLYDHAQAVQRKGACCAGQDIHDARRVAERINIPHYVLNYEDRFKQSVVDDFVETYLAGQTPIPCVTCNQTVKFRDLLDTAQDLQADVLATGHYVQRVERDGHAHMLQGADPGKDQSYFLFATTQEQLDYLRFPLGGMHKQQTRALAEKYGLAVSDKPDSQDICFVPDGDYASVIKRLRPDALQPGDIVTLDGTVVGQHEGIIHYTIGQRRGLGIAAAEPLYVVRIDSARSQVVVGSRSALAMTQFYIRDVNWLDGALPDQPRDVMIKCRSAQQPRPAQFMPEPGGGGRIILPVAQDSIAPGQACVMYDDARVLGGGWIVRG